MNQLVSIGTSHHVAPIEFRERLAFSEEQLIESHQHLRESDQIQESVILSTCNRVEVYAVLNSVRTAEAAGKVLAEFLSRCHQIDTASLKKWTYLHHNLETIQHLFRVISSLDSMVVGESQILGQVKDAYDTSRSAGSSGPILNRLFTKAFSVGKRIRSETTITTGAVSISYAAVELAKKIFNTLEGKTVAIIGAGEMSELTAKHLIANGVSNVIVANRTYQRAVKVAEKFKGTPLAYDSDLNFLIDADIVISSTNAPDYLIKRQPLVNIMRKRKHRYMFLIDIAVPRDIDPDVSKLDSAFLYNIDDLEAVVASNLQDRQQEAIHAEQIVSEEAKRFYDQLQVFQVNPTIKALHQQFRQIADTELQACFYKTTLSDAQEEAIASMTQAIVKKLLHHPMKNLRGAVNDGDADHGQYIQALQELFVLDVNDENPE
ncbi:glutamyl-tRNA reductase [Candidatus Poribacteria bacterium]|nr:glutamyl-tRNA reductase [Candidatus Poribacteria bacterium]MYA54671.1 glutamyl-tRNA reductase [Candidatus Poribacteria bacterium]